MSDSPKTRFLKTAAAKQFEEWSARPEFQSALDAALLQFNDVLGNTGGGDHLSAAAKRYMSEGATSLARLLSSIAIKEEAPFVEHFGHLKGNI